MLLPPIKRQSFDEYSSIGKGVLPLKVPEPFRWNQKRASSLLTTRTVRKRLLYTSTRRSMRHEEKRSKESADKFGPGRYHAPLIQKKYPPQHYFQADTSFQRCKASLGYSKSQLLLEL